MFAPRQDPQALQALQAEIAHLRAELATAKAATDRPHFVSDYTAYVRWLIETHPLDAAMAFAVGGGDFDQTGRLMVGVLRKCGLHEGMSLVDLGCGSGRLAKHLGLNFPDMDYLGIDIVQELLDYAATLSPAHFRFKLNHSLTLPAPDGSADMVVAFSVFTHLLHQESYCYLEEAKRVLRPGGRVVFSFLESPSNGPIFDGMVSRARAGQKDDQLNMFTERVQLEAWAAQLDMEVLGYDFGTPHTGNGQTVTVFRRS